MNSFGDFQNSSASSIDDILLMDISDDQPMIATPNDVLIPVTLTKTETILHIIFISQVGKHSHILITLKCYFNLYCI